MPTPIKTAIRELINEPKRTAAVATVQNFLPATFGPDDLAASQAGFQSLQQLYNILQQDFDHSEQRLNNSDSPLHRREFTRAAFAMIEGILYGMKAAVVSRTTALPPGLFSKAELDCFTETTIRVENGKPTSTPCHPKLAENVVIAFNAYLKNAGSGLIIRPGGAPWQRFCDAIPIRHRVTHPKTPASLVITVEERTQVHDAAYWFGQTAGNVLLEAAKATARTMAAALPHFQAEAVRLVQALVTDPSNVTIREQHAALTRICADMAEAIGAMARL